MWQQEQPGGWGACGGGRSWGTWAWLTRVYSEGDRKPLSIRKRLLQCREVIL